MKKHSFTDEELAKYTITQCLLMLQLTGLGDYWHHIKIGEKEFLRDFEQGDPVVNVFELYYKKIKENESKIKED